MGERLPVESTVVMSSEVMGEMIRSLAGQIASAAERLEDVVMLGILRRGVPLAVRLSNAIGEMTGITPPVGALATTLYRDDRTAHLGVGYTKFDFDVNGRTVILVDDVLAAGRTIRAAMDEVMDYGRPARIQLACLIDRGRRELPIQPDFLAHSVPTLKHEWVEVHMAEIDGEDLVLLERYEAPAAEGEAPQ